MVPKRLIQKTGLVGCKIMVLGQAGSLLSSDAWSNMGFVFIGVTAGSLLCMGGGVVWEISV
jgi:hypothetical protein